MVRQIEAIFSHGAFRPIEPLVLPEGTRVHLRVEGADPPDPGSAPPAAKIHTPKLANPHDVTDFVMEVRAKGEAGDAGV